MCLVKFSRQRGWIDTPFWDGVVGSVSYGLFVTLT